MPNTETFSHVKIKENLFRKAFENLSRSMPNDKLIK